MKFRWERQTKAFIKKGMAFLKQMENSSWLLDEDGEALYQIFKSSKKYAVEAKKGSSSHKKKRVISI